MSNIEKSWFCPTALPTFAPFLGQTGIFAEKSQYHLKRLMVFYLYAKKYKKRLNWSKDITLFIWKIERSDWSRAFTHKSQELEFSQIWGLRRKLANQKTLHFRRFLAKTNDSILHKSPKSPFFPFLDPFFPFLGKWEFCRKNGIWGQFIPFNAL